LPWLRILGWTVCRTSVTGYRVSGKLKEEIMSNKDDDIMKYLLAEHAAFLEAGKETGKVEFTCPLCGGKAIGYRYEYEGYDGSRNTGALGSGCIKCGISHT
jgi:hypothetical protein